MSREKLSKYNIVREDMVANQSNSAFKPNARAFRKPIPTPRRSVKSMVNAYENNIILPPLEFRDKPVPKPRNFIIPPPLQFRDRPVPAPRNFIIPPPPQFRDRKPVPTPRTKIIQLDEALEGFTKSFKIQIKHQKNPLIQLEMTRKVIEYNLGKMLALYKGIKYNETLKVTFTKTSGEQLITKTAYFTSPVEIVVDDSQIADALQFSKANILNKIGVWVSEGSGWTIKSVNSHYINIAKYKPLKGSSYINLPDELKNPKKGLINPQNKDNKCFMWCHIRHLNPQNKDPQRIKKSDKLFVDNLNYSGIEFPVSARQYNKVEKQNNINVNVFCYEEKQIFPIHISKEKNEDCLNLLLITENEKNHYVLIKDINRLFFNQTKDHKRKYFCICCLQHFPSEERLSKHKESCLTINGVQKINMPEKGKNTLEYKDSGRDQKVPFVIYADFEAIVEKVEGCERNDEKSFTEAYQKHTDCGFGYKLVCSVNDKYTKPDVCYRGKNAAKIFMNCMMREVEYCKDLIKHELYELKKNFDNFKIPVVFHNLKGYDSHFIMQQIGRLANKYENLEINVIPNNMEKYMAFMLGKHLVFIDSFQFMSSSLDKLVSNLPKDKFVYTSQVFQDKKFDLMSKTGVYPYDYMDSFEKFDEPLPPKEEFYSILNDKHISDDDYQHAKDVWETFG